MDTDISANQYVSQNFDPSNGFNKEDSVIYYTSNSHFKDKSPNGIAIWFSDDFRIKIVKIYDEFSGQLIWKRSGKQVVCKKSALEYAGLYGDFYKEEVPSLDEIEMFMVKHVDKIKTPAVRIHIRTIFQNPNSEYFVIKEMKEDSIVKQ